MVSRLSHAHGMKGKVMSSCVARSVGWGSVGKFGKCGEYDVTPERLGCGNPQRVKGWVVALACSRDKAEGVSATGFAGD